MSPEESRAARMRNASMLMAAYLGARSRMTPAQAYAAALRWVSSCNEYLARCKVTE